MTFVANKFAFVSFVCKVLLYFLYSLIVRYSFFGLTILHPTESNDWIKTSIFSFPKFNDKLSMVKSNFGYDIGPAES